MDNTPTVRIPDSNCVWCKGLGHIYQLPDDISPVGRVEQCECLYKKKTP